MGLCDWKEKYNSGAALELTVNFPGHEPWNQIQTQVLLLKIRSDFMFRIYFIFLPETWSINFQQVKVSRHICVRAASITVIYLGT